MTFCRFGLHSRKILSAVILAGTVFFPNLTRSEANMPVDCFPCLAPDNGGTADYPHPCMYTSYYGQLMYIINGLPVATTIEIKPRLTNYSGVVRFPGGTLGGEVIQFSAMLEMSMTGTGSLSGFNRSAIIPVQMEVHTSPKTPGTIVQRFDMDMRQKMGQIVGDPDFDLLRITAGTTFGMPSPGHTSLSEEGSDWSVSSFFDVTYRIDFVGRVGGPLSGMSGSTTGTIRLAQGCPRWRPGDDHKMHFPQPADEFGWDVWATWPEILGDDWRCTESGPVKDFHFWGSWRNGQRGTIRWFEIKIYDDVPAGPGVPYSHPGQLLWQTTVDQYVMTPIITGMTEGWYEPENGIFNHPDHAEYWQYDILLPPPLWFNQNFGQIYWLVISAVVPEAPLLQWGWKSSSLHYNDDAVDNRDITCIRPDFGGTTTMPALCTFLSDDNMLIANGLPPATTIECKPEIFIQGPVNESPGGTLGGTVGSSHGQIDLQMTGTGSMSGYSRFIQVPCPFGQNEHHMAPRMVGSSPQNFPTEWFRLFGQLPPGDPDFDLLRITGGGGFGMPSPGHTTLTQLPGPSWQVESFFDITYRIDFVGRAGGPFGGMSGSTTGTIRVFQNREEWAELYEPPLFDQSLDLSFVVTGGVTSCCVGNTGNVDCDPFDQVDISDLTVLIDHLFINNPPLCCYEEGNTDGMGIVDISDLTVLIDHLFINNPPTAPCL